MLYRVQWRAEQGIVNGLSDQVFAPNAAVTRGQVATILVRYRENINC
ncbi:MAG: S-layer homology domain-containing protein [Ruminococcaceae bacterium]|nr:S-layer homology domain-containing protein [Oscillospiraceae bacterium]